MVASQAGRGDSPAVLLKGILGHEWDEDIDNGFRPAVRFSSRLVSSRLVSSRLAISIE